jgi:hypothetical protein
MSDNKILSRIFGPEREVIGWLKKLHNDELNYVCSPPHMPYTGIYYSNLLNSGERLHRLIGYYVMSIFRFYSIKKACRCTSGVGFA